MKSRSHRSGLGKIGDRIGDRIAAARRPPPAARHPPAARRPPPPAAALGRSEIGSDRIGSRGRSEIGSEMGIGDRRITQPATAAESLRALFTNSVRRMPCSCRSRGWKRLRNTRKQMAKYNLGVPTAKTSAQHNSSTRDEHEVRSNCKALALSQTLPTQKCKSQRWLRPARRGHLKFSGLSCCRPNSSGSLTHTRHCQSIVRELAHHQ